MNMLAAALLLVLAAVAVVEVARVVAGLRRGVRLNRAMHELRRPLQAVSLSIEGRTPDLSRAGACLEQARVALADLDAAVNGRRPAPARVVPSALGELTGALERRWNSLAVELEGADSEWVVEADPARLGAALDNLVANALEHGSAPVRVRALGTERSVRFEVYDAGPGAGEPAPPLDPRRGHGLGLVGELAASHGGSVVAPRRTRGDETVAAISLPAAPRDRGIAAAG